MEILKIAALCIGLATIGWLAQKFTTRCPNCGSIGKSKYLSRRHVGNDTTRQYSTGSKRRNDRIYAERHECKVCGHRFSKRSRVQQRL